MSTVKRGRPTKCTPPIIAAYLEQVRFGLSLDSAAAKAGIHTDATLLNWRNRGETGEEPFASFLVQEKEAMADWERTRLEAMDAAGPNWTREAWKLERRMPEQYGKRERRDVQLTGANGGPVEIAHSGRLELSGEAALAVVQFHDTAEDEPDASAEG